MKKFLVGCFALVLAASAFAKDIPHYTTNDSEYFENGKRFYERPDMSDSYLDTLGEEGQLIKLGKKWFENTNVWYGPNAVGNTYTVGNQSVTVDKPYSGKMACNRCHVDLGLKPDMYPVYGAYNRFGFKSEGAPGVYTAAGGYKRDAVERTADCTLNCNGPAYRVPLKNADGTPNLFSTSIAAYLKYAASGLVDKEGIPPKSRASMVAGGPIDFKTNKGTGRELYEDKCKSCHQDNLLGRYDSDAKQYRYPPLTGADSWTTTGGPYGLTGMAKAMGNILHMPYGDDADERPTWTEAMHIAAYVNSKGPRYWKYNARTVFSGNHPETGLPNAFLRSALNPPEIGYFPKGMMDAFTYNELKFGLSNGGFEPVKAWLGSKKAACEATGQDANAAECATEIMDVEDYPSWLVYQPLDQ